MIRWRVAVGGGRMAVLGLVLLLGPSSAVVPLARSSIERAPATGRATRYADPTPDLELLEVTLPGNPPTRVL